MPEAGRTVDEGDDEAVAEACLTREVEAVDSDLGDETDTPLERVVAAAAFTEEGPDEDDAEDACSTDWAGVDDVSGKAVDCRKEVTKLDVAELSGHAGKSHGSTEQHPLKPFLEQTYNRVPVPQDCCRRTCEMPMFLSDEPNQRCTMAY